MSFPLVTVVIPAYNHGKHVARGIQSVLDQDYDPLEVVVIDDGSRDDTWAQIERYAKTAPRPFTAIHQENAGVCRTLNRGVRESHGELVAVMGSDDYFLPGKIQAQVEMFQAGTPRLALVHTGAYLDYQGGSQLEDITGAYRPARGACFDDVMTQAVRIVAPSAMFRRQAFDAIGGFDETLEAEDVDFYIRLAAEGFEFQFVPRPLLVKTVAEGSGGTRLRQLIKVHERILEKQRGRLSETRYRDLHALMHRHLVMLAASAGDYRLATEAAFGLARRTKSLTPLGGLAFWATRGAMLRALPRRVRHGLRIGRARLRAR